MNNKGELAINASSPFLLVRNAGLEPATFSFGGCIYIYSVKTLKRGSSVVYDIFKGD